MASSMDVDSPKPQDGVEKKIAVHPLAIIHMSDQYTRITCGGSPLPRNSPVVGLLFGMISSTTSSAKKDSKGPTTTQLLEMKDADDIPTEVNNTTTLQIELHKAVFPQHSVVGWYRVSDEDEPTPHDLETTKMLRQHFSLDDFVFCQLQVQNVLKGKSKQDIASDAEKSTLQQELPMNMYQVHTEGSSSVLLAVDQNNWHLATSESERIAVERVIREQPKVTTGTKQSSSGKGQHSDDNEEVSSPFILQTDSVQFSLKSMNDRVDVLVQFLEDTHAGKIPINHGLLRDVQSLATMLGPMSAQTKRQDLGGDVQILSHLATLGKTVSVIHAYTEKFKPVYSVGGGPKEMRRAF